MRSSLTKHSRNCKLSFLLHFAFRPGSSPAPSFQCSTVLWRSFPVFAHLLSRGHASYRDEDGGGDVDFDEFWTWFQNAPKTGSGLAAEMQRGLKRSEMLRNARDAMFAAFDSGSEAQRHLRELFDRLDEDGGRGIDADELTDLANGLRLNMTRAEIEEAVGQIDATNSGEIEFHEFYQWWISDSRGAAGRLRSKLKLSAFLAKKAGSLLVAVELADDSEGLQASEQYMANILAQSFSRTHVLQGNSLGVFSPDSPLRILCNEILNYKHTERALICLIFINMIIMAFPVADSGLKATAAATNLAIGVAFTAETTMRIIQLGLFRGVTFDDGTTANTSYLTSWWNAFDLGIISLWWFVLLFAAIFGWDVRVVNSVSVFRSVRSLRFFPHVRQILSSIKQSTIMILDVTYIFAMLFIICASRQLSLHQRLHFELTVAPRLCRWCCYANAAWWCADANMCCTRRQHFKSLQLLFLRRGAAGFAVSIFSWLCRFWIGMLQRSRQSYISTWCTGRSYDQVWIRLDWSCADDYVLDGNA